MACAAWRRLLGLRRLPAAATAAAHMRLTHLALRPACMQEPTPSQEPDPEPSTASSTDEPVVDDAPVSPKPVTEEPVAEEPEEPTA